MCVFALPYARVLVVFTIKWEFFFILALLDKETTEEAEQEVHEEETKDNKEIKQIQDGEDDEVNKDGDEDAEAKKKGEDDEETNKDEEDKTDAKEEEINEDPNKPNEEDLMKVIKYLLAAGCDINKQVNISDYYWFHKAKIIVYFNS